MATTALPAAAGAGIVFWLLSYGVERVSIFYRGLQGKGVPAIKELEDALLLFLNI